MHCETILYEETDYLNITLQMLCKILLKYAKNIRVNGIGYTSYIYSQRDGVAGGKGEFLFDVYNVMFYKRHKPSY